MFFLTKISDVIPIQPEAFSRPTEKALENEINIKYANRVIHKVGLCISLYDINSIGDSLVRPGDGAAYIKTEFRMIVFRPFVGEVLVGWVSSCSEEGLRVKMEFFNDIHIPRSLLFEDCVFIPTEQAWVWRVPGETEGEHTDLYIDTNEKIRFRVEKEVFTDIHPQGPGERPEDERTRPPYAIIGSCQADGMGLVSWWEG